MEVSLSTALAIAEKLDKVNISEENEIHHYSLTYSRREVGKITPLNGRERELEELSEEEIPVRYDVDLGLLGELKRQEFENYRQNF